MQMYLHLVRFNIVFDVPHVICVVWEKKFGFAVTQVTTEYKICIAIFILLPGNYSESSENLK